MKKIAPQELIQSLTIEDLNASAELYYSHLSDTYFQLAKPFSSIAEAPILLYKLGLLLAGLRLGKTMSVLDFGAGSCWLSRFLTQMDCFTISVDVSETALKLGQELFAKLPPLGEQWLPPQFLVFNGRSLDIDNESVDRIICFDAFHHIPNQQQVLSEFFRVLKPGGIVGFSEPGRSHSQSPQAQYEMRNYTVLENDIVLREIKTLAENIGFGELRVKLVNNPYLDLTYSDYIKLTRWHILPWKGWQTAVTSTRENTLFFLTKGEYVADSRNPAGLQHEITLQAKPTTAHAGAPVTLKVQAKNTGSSKWLHTNIQDMGVVKIGVHLLSETLELINLDFARCLFEHDVWPGESITKTFSVILDKPGNYMLGIDLVAEKVCWFENLGSKVQYLPIRIEK